MVKIKWVTKLCWTPKFYFTSYRSAIVPLHLNFAAHICFQIFEISLEVS